MSTRTPIPLPMHRRAAAALLLGFAGAAAVAAATTAHGASTVCEVRSGATVAPVVELYTSEGCNSCPPADRWLSALKADAGIVALAFHVDYWDRLGWKDRFASPAHTQRQALQQQVNGARFSYTPQVVVDGMDRKDWHARPAPASAAARPDSAVAIALRRDGEQVIATVRAHTGAPARLAAFWAVTENDHVTPVKAGENAGATLRHDHVVREYQPVGAWDSSATDGATLRYRPRTPATAGHARSVNLVVLDAVTGRPVQALNLGC